MHWAQSDRRLRWALALAALVVVAVSVWLVMPDGVGTGIGERRVVVLDDGSRVTLNTDTRIRSDYTDQYRVVTLDRAEARFEVAKDATCPFAVRSTAGEVVAIGTVFTVRRFDDTRAVTLIEGQIAVRPPTPRAGQPAPLKVMVHPGERVKVSRTSVSTLFDQPRIDQLTAWRRGEAPFEDVPLSEEAVAEMNRYSRTRMVLADDALATRRISGVFHTGDNLAFAQAVAELHGLTISNRDERLELVQQAGTAAKSAR